MNSGVKRCTHPVDGDVINGDTALGQQLLNIPVGQPIAQVPADRDRYLFRREPEASKDRGRAKCSHPTSLQPSAIDQHNRAQIAALTWEAAWVTWPSRPVRQAPGGTGA